MYQLRPILAPRFALILMRYVDGDYVVVGAVVDNWRKVSFLFLGRVKVIYSRFLLTYNAVCRQPKK